MLRIICFAEASADARIGSELGDRVMAEEGPDWVEPDLLDVLRYWTGLDTAEPFTAWTTLKRVGRQRGRPRYIGHRTGGAKGSDYAIAVKALQQAALVSSADQTLAVVMLRDQDAATDARVGLRQATDEPQFQSLSVIVGVADKMRESWVLSGWSPESDEEAARLERCRRVLGFDPTASPERLRAANDGEPRHAKTVLRELTNDDRDREARCWRVPPLARLRDRGRKNGLADFLAEIPFPGRCPGLS